MLDLILSAALLVGPATAACTREVLGQVASKFLNNIKNGRPLELTSPSTYTENFKDINIASGVFSKAIKFTHSRTLLDGPGCAIYVEIIAPDNKPGYHIGTQIFVDAGKANKVEAIINSDVPNSNSWFYNGTRTLDVILKEEAEGGRAVIPEAKRDSRETLKQVAEDYFNLVGSAKGAKGGPKKMPKFAPGCMRQEGGFPKSIPCTLGAPPDNKSSGTKSSSGSSPRPASKSTVRSLSSRGLASNVRGLVIDETVGTVEAFGYFMGAAPDTHDFRVEGGQVRYVHAITVMSTSAFPGNVAPGAPKGTRPKGAAAP